LPNSVVVVNGKQFVVENTDGTTRTVRATDGIMRMLQLLKHHFLSTNFSFVIVPTGRYRLS
jgi:hypothetical protein